MCIHKITGASYLIDTTARNTPLDHSHTVTQRSVRTLTNRWPNVGPTSQTLAQHLASDLHKRLPKSPYSGAGLSDKAESGRWPSSKPRLSPPSLAPSILKFICHTTDGREIILPVFRRLVCPPPPPTLAAPRRFFRSTSMLHLCVLGGGIQEATQFTFAHVGLNFLIINYTLIVLINSLCIIMIGYD